MNKQDLVQKAVKHYFEAQKDANDDKVLLHIPSVMADFADEQLEAEVFPLRIRLGLLVDDIHREVCAVVNEDGEGLDAVALLAKASGKKEIAARILAILSDSDASDAEKGTVSRG